MKKIEFQANPIFRYHATQNEAKFKDKLGVLKMVYITHHPFKEVFVSIGLDETLFLWNMQKKSVILDKKLDETPTCVKFDSQGNFLAVGFETGNLILFNTVVISQYLEDGLGDNRKQDPQQNNMLLDLKIEMVFNFACPIITIEFSDSDKLLAVSLSYQRFRDIEHSDNIEGGFVDVFDFEKMIEEEFDMFNSSKGFQYKYHLCTIKNSAMNAEKSQQLGGNNMACQF